MAKNWLALTTDNRLVAQEGIGLEVRMCLGLFYADGNVVGSRDLEWLQGAMNVLIGLFRRYGLVTNFVKSKAMTCQPGTLQSGMLEKSVG